MTIKSVSFILAISAVVGSTAPLANQVSMRSYCRQHGTIVGCTTPHHAASATIAHNRTFHAAPNSAYSARMQRCGLATL